MHRDLKRLVSIFEKIFRRLDQKEEVEALRSRIEKTEQFHEKLATKLGEHYERRPVRTTKKTDSGGMEEGTGESEPESPSKDGDDTNQPRDSD